MAIAEVLAEPRRGYERRAGESVLQREIEALGWSTGAGSTVGSFVYGELSPPAGS